jgi:hypothetical protein
VCLVARRAAIPNTIHSVPGQRTYWRTLALTDPNADPEAYLDFPTRNDEEFVEGTIRALASRLVGVFVVEGEATAEFEAALPRCRAASVGDPSPHAAEVPSAPSP